MAAALIDRLLHHCHMVNIRSNSDRLREHQQQRRRRPKEQRAEAETSQSTTEGQLRSYVQL